MLTLHSPHFFFMQRFTPTSPTQCVMRYEVYRHKDASDADFNLISDMYKRIMSEDKYLCVNTQKNLDAGVFVNGQLHPKMEQGPLHFQKTVRDVVVEHYGKEETAGHQIWPAKRDLPADVAVSQDQENVALRTGGHVDTFKDAMGTGLSTVTAIAV